MVKVGSKNNISSAAKQRWKIGSTVIITLLVAFGVFLAWLFYVGSSKEIVAVADQFKPDPSWELKSENIVPPQTICIDVECPSVHRQWKTDTLLTREQLVSYLDIADWDLTINGDCKVNPNSYGGGLPVCSANGIVDDYSVNITIDGSSTPNNSGVNLSIKRS